jgi:lipid-binding SYLF domain-containing protein
MYNKKYRSSVFVLSALVMTQLASKAAFAEHEEEAKRAREAAAVVDSIMASPDKSIPSDLLKKAHGIAVIPNVVKGALVVGGQFGKGLVAQRDGKGGWGTPAFVDIGGGSFGLQIGVEATDLILVFTKPDGLTELLKDNLKLSAEAGAVAGPVGREVQAGTNLTFDSPIYSYSRNKGVFVGVSLDGSVVQIDDSSNEEVYGKGVTGTDILVKKTVASNTTTAPFVKALSRHSKGGPTQ